MTPSALTEMADGGARVRAGLLFAITAYTLWGLMPVYLKSLGPVSALEIVAHRIVWSVPFGALLIIWRRQFPEVRNALADPSILRVPWRSRLSLYPATG